MDPLTLLRDGVALPVLVALVVARLVGGPARGDATLRRELGGVAAVSACWLIFARPRMFSLETAPWVAADWLWAAGWVVLLLGVARALGALDRWGAAALRIAAAAIVAWFATEPRRVHAWSSLQGVVVVCASAGLVGLGWTAADRFADRARPAQALGGLALWALAAAGALVATGSVTYGLLTAPVGWALLVQAGRAAGGPVAHSAAAAATTAAPLVAGMVGLGVAFSSMPVWLAVALCLTPLLLRLLPAGE